MGLPALTDRTCATLIGCRRPPGDVARGRVRRPDRRLRRLLPRCRRRPSARRWRSRSPTRCRGTASARGCSSGWPSMAREARASTTFDAYVLGDNRRMLDVFRDLRLRRDRRHRAGRLSRRPVARGHRALRRTRRPRVAQRGDGVDAGVLRAARGGRRRRQPRARQDRLRDPAQPGGAGFTGTIVPVHPTRRADRRAAAYPRVVDIPGRSISPSSSCRPRTCSRPSTTASRRTCGRSASSAPASANAAPKAGRARRCSSSGCAAPAAG